MDRFELLPIIYENFYLPFYEKTYSHVLPNYKSKDKRHKDISQLLLHHMIHISHKTSYQLSFYSTIQLFSLEPSSFSGAFRKPSLRAKSNNFSAFSSRPWNPTSKHGHSGRFIKKQLSLWLARKFLNRTYGQIDGWMEGLRIQLQLVAISYRAQQERDDAKQILRSFL